MKNPNKVTLHSFAVIVAAIIGGAAVIFAALIDQGLFSPSPTPTALPASTHTLPPPVTVATTDVPAPVPPSPPSEDGNFQNFEDNNGTPRGEYCVDIWYAECLRTQVHNSSFLEVTASAQLNGEAGAEGGTVRINAASSDPIDLSNAKTFFVSVLDKQGSNDIELRLCTDSGCYPLEQSSEGIWSESSKSVKDTWTTITWDLSRFPDFDRSKIIYIQLSERHDGTYYFDNIGWK